MSSINIETSLLTIVLVLVGPAFVFLRASKLATVAMIYRRYGLDVSARAEMPHRDYVTYVFFPLALAGVLWLGNHTPLTLLENFDASYLELIFDPGWLLKYSLFAWIIATLGMAFGAITGLGFAPVARIVGVQIDDAEEGETEQPEKPEQHLDKRPK